MKRMFNHTKRPEQEYNPNDYEWEYDAIEDGMPAEENQDETGEWTDTTDGYYDENGEWVATTGGYYDENGEWVDTTGGYYDENGEWVDTTGGYYDENGEWVDTTGGYYDENGEWVDTTGGYYDENGEWVDTTGGYYDENGEWVDTTGGYYDENGEWVAAGAVLYETDEEVQQETAEVMSGVAMMEAEEEEPEENEDEYPEEENDRSVIIRSGSNRINVMDYVIAIASIFVLILVVIVGGTYIKSKSAGDQSADFVTVGTQLQDIDLVGDEGLTAIGQAEKNRIEQILAEKEKEEEENAGYNENDYNQHVSVGFSLTSVLKDLKIKFTNKTTKKLISSVPFAIEITDGGGNVQVWTDDDRDGVIYKDALTPGTYEVKMVALEEAKYDKYTIPTLVQSVVVRKDLTYTKVDVSNEIKSESEIDASKEDTKKNETELESVLPDTVTWVESSMTGNSYIEVPKSTITDPTKLVASNGFVKTSLVKLLTATVTPDSPSVADPSVTPSDPGVTPSEPSVTPSEPSVTPSVEPSTTPSVEPSTAPGTETDTTTGTETESGSTETEEDNVLKPIGSLALSNANVQLYLNGTTEQPSVMNVKATASDFTEGKAVTYSIESYPADVVTASVGATTGDVGIVAKAAGKGTIVVAANYAENGTATTKKTATINVEVINAKKPVLTLAKTQTTIYLNADTLAEIGLTIDPKVEGGKVEFEVKDPNYFKAEWDAAKNVIRLTGWAEINSSFTVKYTYAEGVEPVTATCAVTVKKHPKNDTSTALLDQSNRAIYVYENDKYRAATYADYYTASKFFVQGSPKYTGWQTIDGKLYFFTAAGDKVTGEQVIQGAKYTFASDGSLVTGSGTLGIDVSKWNGTINWNAVKNSGVSYVIIRCGYRGSSKGALVEDPKFKENIKGATAAGLKVGVYFFTQAVNEVEAVEEASMVLDLVKNYKISYPIFLDVESSGGRADSLDKNTRTRIVKTFCETIRNAGYTPGVYANKNWLTTKLNASELNAYKIWLAQYAATPTYTGRYDLWQYKDTGKVSGISGNVDLNISYLGY